MLILFGFTHTNYKRSIQTSPIIKHYKVPSLAVFCLNPANRQRQRYKDRQTDRQTRQLKQVHLVRATQLIKWQFCCTNDLWWTNSSQCTDTTTSATKYVTTDLYHSSHTDITLAALHSTLCTPPISTALTSLPVILYSASWHIQQFSFIIFCFHNDTIK